jgi:hypothetical protein
MVVSNGRFGKEIGPSTPGDGETTCILMVPEGLSYGRPVDSVAMIVVVSSTTFLVKRSTVVFKWCSSSKAQLSRGN